MGLNSFNTHLSHSG